MLRSAPLLRPLFTAFLGLFSAVLAAHSIPDIPVRGTFQTGGEAEISIEINPRNFSVFFYSINGNVNLSFHGPG